ncbi:hypothetical protein NDU88_004556 [Pleurodeles waltl]|uniref:Uncharacterized protein n=1 Tax=Pleurodeles waltl TaxID=8319 RepID=A0AAV7VGM7_PLEWA|nr:hypothetical protein NDU88_004556 [Pleurodeles waltl]
MPQRRRRPAAHQNGAEEPSIPREEQYNATEIRRAAPAAQEAPSENSGQASGEAWPIQLKQDDQFGRTPLASIQKDGTYFSVSPRLTPDFKMAAEAMSQHDVLRVRAAVHTHMNQYTIQSPPKNKIYQERPWRRNA